jgi:hypothetical protein
MPVTGGPEHNNPFKLPNRDAPLDCPDGSVWTNITKKEFRIRFGENCEFIPNSGYNRMYVTKDDDQEIPVSAGWTNVTWNQEEYDADGMHDTVTNNDRCTILLDGLYTFFFKIETEASDKSSYQVRLFKNGLYEIEGSRLRGIGSKDASTIILIGATPIMSFSEDDFIVVQVNHDNDSIQDVLSTNSLFFCERRY